ncbi:hypothetical protein [uncultured Deinococcus sp.]|uniref:hypothetical protein n=1 Tax=uncultured Deinococcus sp. TaxID=158789 RepID=UPI00258E39A3|nr:hypothetical protein [uncultured Deinococcus sp.]
MKTLTRLFPVLTLTVALGAAPLAAAQTATLPTPLLTTDTAQLEVFAQTPAVAVVTYYSAEPTDKDTQVLGETTLNWRNNAARTAQIQAGAPVGTRYVRIYTAGQATVLPYDAAFVAGVETLADQTRLPRPALALD